MVRLNSKLMSVPLLGAFLLMMVHNIVPHTHHDHSKSEVLFEHTSNHCHAHDKSHEQSDDQNPEKENDDGFLLLYFAYHSHSNPTNDFIATAQADSIALDGNSFYPQAFLHSYAFNSIYALRQIGKYYKSPTRFYENFSISNSSSRAPPCLG